ncbi:unnamed protein product, partial [Fusarium langsethiae]
MGKSWWRSCLKWRGLAVDAKAMIIETPPPITVTTIQLYTGSSTLTGPITVTIPASGTTPGTVIIETPPPAPITSTCQYTGTSILTSPITVTTIPPSGTIPGTVIIETPPPELVTSTRQYTGTSTLTGPVTVTTIPPSGTVPGTVIIETPPPLPTFSCDQGGYLIQSRALYRLNLVTGENVLVRDPVGPEGNINGIGYNVLDNLIWGVVIGTTVSPIIRIGPDGSYTLVGAILPRPDSSVSGGTAWNVGDVDPDGNFWVATNGRQWSLDNFDWKIVRDYGNVVGNNVWAAVYAVGNGIFYASENTSGDIYQFDINAGAPVRVTAGPSSSNNDGGTKKANFFQNSAIDKVSKTPNGDDAFIAKASYYSWEITSRDLYGKLDVVMSNPAGFKSKMVFKRIWQSKGEQATGAARIWTGKISWSQYASDEMGIFIVPEGFGEGKPVISMWQWSRDGTGTEKAPSFRDASQKMLSDAGKGVKFSYHSYYDITCTWNEQTEKLSVHMKGPEANQDLGEFTLSALIDRHSHDWNPPEFSAPEKTEV